MAAFAVTVGTHATGGLIADVAWDVFGTARSGFTGSAVYPPVSEYVAPATAGNFAADATAIILLASLGDSGTGSRSTLVADAAGNLRGTTYGGSSIARGSAPGTMLEVTGSRSVAAPEPSSLVLAAAAGAGLLGRRRRL